MSLADRMQILDDAIRPHLETEEGKAFLIGLETTEDIRVSLQLIAAPITSLALPHANIIKPLDASCGSPTLPVNTSIREPTRC